VLHQTTGNRRQAAAILGISTTTLWRKLKRVPK
jgi:transcriptional regulator of acetoin/glycerol metabolism